MNYEFKLNAYAKELCNFADIYANEATKRKINFAYDYHAVVNTVNNTLQVPDGTTELIGNRVYLVKEYTEYPLKTNSVDIVISDSAADEIVSDISMNTYNRIVYPLLKRAVEELYSRLNSDTTYLVPSRHTILYNPAISSSYSYWTKDPEGYVLTVTHTYAEINK